MRVLQVINSLKTGGAEKLLLDSIPKYNDQGISMDLLLLDGYDTPFLKILKEQSKRVIYTLGKGSVYNPLHIFKIIKYLKKYDIVHVHLFPALYWTALAKLLSFSKVTLVFTEHSTSNKRRKFYFRLFDRLIYKNYHIIITISKEVDILIKKHLGFKSSKFNLINNGVDIDKINTAKASNSSDFDISNSEKIIVQVSSFRYPKDQKTLIRSLPYISKPVKLLLVGEGPLLEECKILAEELEIEDHVLFLGVRMDVPELLKMADIVVLSSYYEGLSISCIEALASGSPLIASDVPGISQIVKGAGVLFPVGGVESLAEEINKLLSNKEYYSDIVDRCLIRAKQYSLDSMIEKHINLYKQVCPSQN